ncbi:MAG: non-heme iron oxygenase ferredoxin subunit [Anaerolineae bacterium]|jgi:3-phenylpropionate/trans-cinnamate dioxygenase ferredoxin component|nr:non-heme iron oxygenase ferredoxin subunit [Anaerolineae bacterium]MBT7069339.1 non-heme iron oxygenase ferredoxin subunit [Anaerolineae bacterium]MBT7325945.1 non-heme iron oxygenase ferredoxin subunit [Anaerolineae bacterium]
MNYTIYPEEKCDFFEILPINDLPSGERLFVELGDIPIVIFNIADTFYAIKDQCSHEDLEIGDGDLEGHDLSCPHHGAHFDVRTGEALTLPAVEGIPAYPVRVRKGNLEVGLPKE